MLISWLFFKAHYPVPIILSFVPVLVGTLISTYYDLQFNVFGLTCKFIFRVHEEDPSIDCLFLGAFISVFFTSLYQILVEHYQKIYNCDSLQLLLYQAPLSGLLLLLFVPFYEPLADLPKHINSTTVCLILICGIIAFFVNFSVFWVIGNLSAVAYNMIGHTKTLLIILIGSMIFHEPLNERQVFGLVFTMLGVLLYSYFKYYKKVTK